MKKMAFLIVAALFCAGLFFNVPVSSQGHKEKVRKNANRIENNYIVVLDDSVVGERGEYIRSQAIWPTIWRGVTAEK